MMNRDRTAPSRRFSELKCCMLVAVLVVLVVNPHTVDAQLPGRSIFLFYYAPRWRFHQTNFFRFFCQNLQKCTIPFSTFNRLHYLIFRIRLRRREIFHLHAYDSNTSIKYAIFDISRQIQMT